jgi:uncharacterized phage-associated protein
MAPSAPYDARQVSNYVIKLGDEVGRPITQMSLLKIIFYAHGWYLAVNGVPLFKQPVEAWEYGPVVKVVRDAFKEFGKSPITKMAERLDLQTGELVQLTSDLSDDDQKFVREIFDNYSKYSAGKLSDMTHEPGSPWDKIWNSSNTVGRLGLRIRNDEIRNYFLSLKSRNSIH